MDEEVLAAPVADLTQEKAVQFRISRKKMWLGGVALAVLLLGLITWRFPWYQPLMDRYNAASITLKVREGDKFSLEGAKVKIKNQVYTTDANGKVALQLVAGSYPITISKDGYQDSSSTLSLHRGDNDLQFIALTKLPDKVYSVKGFVQDYLSGQPVVNAQVTLANKTVTTDPSGAYSFDKVLPGETKLHFSRAGYQELDLPVKIEAADVVTASVPLVPTGQVVFVSNRSGKRALYKTGFDGSNQTPLVSSSDGEDFNPVLSPNNKSLAFSSTRDHLKDEAGNDLVKLYIVGLDGLGLKKVSDDVAPSITPLWSPDGLHLYFSAYTDSKLSASTYRVYDLTKGQVLDIGESASGVTFSPNSNTLAYYTLGTADQPIPSPAASPSPTLSVPTQVTVNILKTFNLLTGERKTLVQKTQYITDLRFSEDGKAVSYEVVIDGSRRRFSTTLADGKETEVPLLSFSAKRHYLFSPDKTEQVFVEERDGKTDLYLVDQSGQNEKKLTVLGVVNDAVLPVWDASGHYLTFAVKRDGENALYAVSVDGGDPKKVVDYFTDRNN